MDDVNRFEITMSWISSLSHISDEDILFHYKFAVMCRNNEAANEYKTEIEKRGLIISYIDK